LVQASLPRAAAENHGLLDPSLREILGAEEERVVVVEREGRMIRRVLRTSQRGLVPGSVVVSGWICRRVE